MWGFPGPGIQPVCVLQGRFLTTGPPGKPLDHRNWGRMWTGFRKEVDEGTGGGRCSGPGHPVSRTLNDGMSLTAGYDCCRSHFSGIVIAQLPGLFIFLPPTNQIYSLLLVSTSAKKISPISNQKWSLSHIFTALSCILAQLHSPFSSFCPWVHCISSKLIDISIKLAMLSFQ